MRRIAVVVARPQRHDSVFWTVRADGSDRRRAAVVNDDSLGGLTWSPDGAFAWSGSFRGIFSVMLMDAGSGEPRQVEPNSEEPVWSADGSRLAYVTGHEGHYEPRIVVGDAWGAGEEAVLVDDDARGGGSLADWASCR